MHVHASLCKPNYYGIAQLQGNIRTRPRCVLHTFWTHPTSGGKGCGSYVSLAAPLSQGIALAQTRIVHPACISDTSNMYSRHVQTLPWN